MSSGGVKALGTGKPVFRNGLKARLKSARGNVPGKSEHRNYGALQGQIERGAVVNDHGLLLLKNIPYLRHLFPLMR